MKNIKWKIMLFVGTLPFLVAIVSGFYAALTGFSGLAIKSPASYGWEAFMEWIILYSFVYWPTYVVGVILMLWAIARLMKSRD